MDVTPVKESDETLLEGLQRRSFAYFLQETDPGTGLVADRNRSGFPASIAATGMALSAYAVGVERGWISREEACGRTLTTLRFLWGCHQGTERNATGYMGFFYHFLDMKTGQRAWNSELSTVDTALLMAGVLSSGAYFDLDCEEEQEIRALATALYRRVDWRWALDGGVLLSHGWKPGRGFLPYHWKGYDEALILYVLALGSPTHCIGPESYSAWLSGYRWKTIYGHEFVYAGPLFIHQMSHLWIDFRGIRDAFMRDKGLDYFENSRRATLVQREYAIRNPRGFEGYSENCWGVTASDGPGKRRETIHGIERYFHGYMARGVPFGPDDGTLSPYAALSSLPFAPEIVLPVMRQFQAIDPARDNPYGVTASFNPTFCTTDGHGWIAEDHIGINQGPIVMMVENHRSGLLWRLMRKCPYVAAGLWKAGFTGGWI
ncbi:glucoamylase family protein [Mesorhizobium sp. 1M-11]|uniref:glucoamylase family protein n=1 Tax=Mesorhizobium sp. 1M-11 TaxID=1529006 RepID=UPI0006C767CE|nr:glucoamylase family protein [Mesorhizobium sp. 1M-11]